MLEGDGDNLAFDVDSEFANIGNIYWFSWWTFFFTLVMIVIWFVAIRPWLIYRSTKFLKKFVKKPGTKIGALKVLINFGIIPLTVATTGFFIILFGIWDNRVVQSTSIFGLVGLTTIGIVQTKIGSGFLSGIEVMLLGAFDEGDDIGVTNQWGILKEGTVKSIDSHGTQMRKFNNLPFTIPNHEIIHAIDITNYTRAKFYFESIPIIPMETEIMQRAATLIGDLIKRKTVKELLDMNGAMYGWWLKECNAGKHVTPRQWARIINPGIDYHATVPSIQVPVLSRLEAEDVRQYIRTQIDGATPMLPAIEEKDKVEPPKKKLLPKPHLPHKRETGKPSPPPAAKPPVNFNPKVEENPPEIKPENNP